MNQFVVSGNITHDLELRRTPDGVPYVKFTVANNDGKHRPDDKANFFRCEAWDTGAEAIVEKFEFRKGSPILVTGWLRHDEWEGPDGAKRQQVVLRVTRFEPMDRRKPDDAPASRADEHPSYAPQGRPARAPRREGAGRDEDAVLDAVADRHEDDSEIPF